MTEVKETMIEPGDAESDVLDALAEHQPHIFIVCKLDPEDGALDLRVVVGGGFSSREGIRMALERTVEALS